MTYERPRARKGHVITRVQWDREGRVREVRYDRPGRADDQPVLIAQPQRGLVSIETMRKPEQPDLF